MKVLVIENSAVICERLLSLLAESGAYQGLGCVPCVSGALERYATDQPDALLLDLRLADGSGFQVLEALRQCQHGVPVIVLSENDSWHYRRRAESLGAAAFLRKSTQFDLILPTLDRVLHASARRASGETE